jgi:hypothetical protein
MAMDYRSYDYPPTWTTSRTLVVIGAVFGTVLAVWALVSVGLGGTVPIQVPTLLTQALLVTAGLNLVLALLIFVTEGVVRHNRTRGGLHVLWGVIGMAVGFGLWFGALLVIIGGFLAVMAESRAYTPPPPMA